LPAADLPLLLAAAEAGGREAMRWWRKGPQVWDKGAEGPVTEADLAVNRLLGGMLRIARPGYGWLSEEDPDTLERLARERVFVLDPIDGTRAFIAGETAFAVSLAVVSAGQPVAAVVHLPAQGVTYAAVAGGGAVRNGTAIRAALTEVPPRVLAGRSQFAAEHWPGGVPAVVPRFRASLAWRLALVAEGAFEAMLTFRPVWEWDAAAGVLIAAEAGARVTDAAGATLRFNAAEPRLPGLIVAAEPLHGTLLAARQPPAAAI
jgi:myo-inositol-1(or 4)-monophosphatase